MSTENVPTATDEQPAAEPTTTQEPAAQPEQTEQAQPEQTEPQSTAV